MTDGRVVIKFDGDDSSLQKSIKSTKSSLSDLKSVIAKIGIGVAITKAFTEGVSAVNEFEASISKASTLFGDVAVNVDELKTKVLELSSATGKSASSIGESLYNALSAGVEVTEDMGSAMSFIEASTKLAVAGFTDVDTAVTATAKVLNAYGMEVSEASKVHEVLMQTQNLGITTVGALGQSLATVTPIASSFGVTFEQVGASLAVMTKQGTDTARATTQLRGLISELGKDGTKASKNLQQAFKNAGLEVTNFADFMSQGGNLQDALRLMKAEADATGISLADMFGNIEGGVGALQLASDETEVYTQFLDGLSKDASLVDDAYSKMMGTRTNTWAKMKEQLKNITIKVTGSEAVQTALDDLTELSQKLLDKVEAWLPTALENLNTFYLKSKLIFAYLAGEYDRSFLKKGVDFVINVVKDEFDEIIESFKKGDIFGSALKLVGNLVTIKIGFSLIQSLGTLISSSFSTAFLTRNGALALVGDALMVYIGFKQAMEDGDWGKFGVALVASLLAGITVGGLTGSITAGAIVFGVSFQLISSIESTPDNAYTRGLKENPDSYVTDNMLKKVNVDKKTKKKFKNMKVKDFMNDFSDIEYILSSKVSSDVIKANEQIVQKVKDLYQTEVGKYILEALGMEEEDFENLGANQAGFYLQGFRNTLGIHSPSRKFAELGKYCVEGLEQGLRTKFEAENYLSEQFDKMFNEISSAVEDGTMSLEESFAELEALLSEKNSLLDKIGKIEVPTTSTTTTTSKATSTSTGGNSDKDIEEKKSALERLADEFENLKGSFIATAGEWAQLGFDTLASGIDALGQALAGNEDAWSDWGKSVLASISSVIMSHGYEMIAEGTLKLFNGATTSIGLAEMAKGAGVIALGGVVKALGNSFENGGIVGGSGYTGDNHMIFANAGELILNRTQQNSLASQLSNQQSRVVTIQFNGTVLGDQESISSWVYDGMERAKANGII